MLIPSVKQPSPFRSTLDSVVGGVQVRRVFLLLTEGHAGFGAQVEREDKRPGSCQPGVEAPWSRDLANLLNLLPQLQTTKASQFLAPVRVLHLLASPI